MPAWKATTVLALSHRGHLVIGSDGQVTLGNTIMKDNVVKVRRLFGGNVLSGFAGSTVDAFTLLNYFEDSLERYGGSIKRSAMELAKMWRTDRAFKRLEAMLIVANVDELFIISGTGDVLEPNVPLAAIGSGGIYAQSAAMALIKHAPHLSAKDIVRESLSIAADVCIYTNHNLVFEELKNEP